MKYFIDTEFLEGKQSKWFGKTKSTIDLISIGIVAEDGREYYAISKDFNLKEAWNRYDIKKEWYSIDESNQSTRDVKVYWIKDNVLKPIWLELLYKDRPFAKVLNENKKIDILDYFTYKEFKKLINKYGKSNEQIAEEVKEFVYEKSFKDNKGTLIIHDNNWLNGKPQFYGYYCDYDWVVFCWLFGNMIDLPKGFPMYCIDLKQESDRIYNLKKEEYTKGGGRNFINKMSNHLDYPRQTNEHNALADARFNRDLYNFLNTI